MDGVKSVIWFGGMFIFNGIVYDIIIVCICEVIVGIIWWCCWCIKCVCECRGVSWRLWKGIRKIVKFS